MAALYGQPLPIAYNAYCPLPGTAPFAACPYGAVLFHSLSTREQRDGLLRRLRFRLFVKVISRALTYWFGGGKVSKLSAR
jgi:hypothetical protein